MTKFLSKKKHKIAYSEHIAKNSKIGVIITHGLAEHKGRYKDFTSQLAENNISVFAMDLRGHGESSGSRGDAKNFKQLLSDLTCFVDYIKTEYTELKIVLFGHSFSGQQALVYSAINPIDGLILSNPLLARPRKTKILNLVPHKICGFVKLKKKHSESAEMLEISRNDPLSCKKFTLRLVGIMFKDGTKQVNKHISNVKCPVLVVAGKLDPLINCSVTEQAFERITQENKTIKIYENVKHRIVQNKGSVERINDIIAWINLL